MATRGARRLVSERLVPLRVALVLGLNPSTNSLSSLLFSASSGLHHTALRTYSTFFLPSASAACFSLPARAVARHLVAHAPRSRTGGAMVM